MSDFWKFFMLNQFYNYIYYFWTLVGIYNDISYFFKLHKSTLKENQIPPTDSDSLITVVYLTDEEWKVKLYVVVLCIVYSCTKGLT